MFSPAAIKFWKLTPPIQRIYIDFGAPQARNLLKLTPPIQGIYIDFGAPQARKIWELKPLIHGIYIDLKRYRRENFGDLHRPYKGYTSILERRETILET